MILIWVLYDFEGGFLYSYEYGDLYDYVTDICMAVRRPWPPRGTFPETLDLNQFRYLNQSGGNAHTHRKQRTPKNQQHFVLTCLFRKLPCQLRAKLRS